MKSKGNEKIHGIQPTLSCNSLSPKSNQHQFFSSQQHQQIITRLGYENKIIKYNHLRQNALTLQKIPSTNDFRKCMDISLEDLYVGLKGSKDTLYNLRRHLSKMLLSFT